ncbi:hypothetical protein [Lunatimonas salinarum]|uniref:hypothetical protein n=1 Tax=Lunatimonas salinarum TaxID=1774590 RepID=UPI001AE01E94|nr:hypothetical protein [Lunatimonas salinarum]
MTTEDKDITTDKKPIPPKISRWSRFYWSFLTLKFKLKRTKFNWEKVTINTFVGLAFFSIVAGLAVFIIFLVKLSHNYSISGDKIEIDTTGQVGDFIGGVVGAVWSLTGVLLFYATLRLQSRELAENRKHFQMSRLTDIIYKQLDLFNQQLLNFKFKDIERDGNGEHIEYKGRTAIALLRKRVEGILETQNKDISDQEKEKVMYQFMGENFAFIEINKKELLNIYEELDNQVSVIRAILIKEDIPPADLNELKSLFFRNIGRDFLNASELLIHLLEWYITHQERGGKKLDELFSPEFSIKRKIAVIEEFRKKRYDKQTIKNYVKSRDMYNETLF